MVSVTLYHCDKCGMENSLVYYMFIIQQNDLAFYNTDVIHWNNYLFSYAGDFFVSEVLAGV
jgi:hypothetical protein